MTTPKNTPAMTSTPKNTNFRNSKSPKITLLIPVCKYANSTPWGQRQPNPVKSDSNFLDKNSDGSFFPEIKLRRVSMLRPALGLAEAGLN